MGPRLRRYRAALAYVGTGFQGWQVQRNAPRTVQAVLENAIRRFASESVRVTAAGRTDAGVHADGQVVHFDLSRAADPVRVREGINALLPWDAKLLRVELVDGEFHARRDALWKDYLYRWSRAAVIPPKDSLFVVPISPAVDPERMRQAAAHLLGRRDFGVFGVRLSSRESSVRTLHAVSIQVSRDEIHALFRGDAFLRGMVRSLCGTLASIGRGKASPDRTAELLDTGDRRLLASKAAARGLTLLRVAYPDREPAES